MPVTNPQTVSKPVGSETEGDTQKEEGTPGTEDLQSIPRTVAGVVNEKGEIVDKSGKVIGSVAEVEDHDKLVGGAVTESGDVVSDLGHSLAKVHIDENYTPQQVPEKKEAGGWNVLGKAKSAMQYGDNIRSAVAYGQNLQNTYSKFTGGQKSGGEETGKDVTSKAGEAAEGGTETAKGQVAEGEEAGHDVAEKAGEVQDKQSIEMENNDDSATKDVGGEAEGLKSQVDEGKDAVDSAQDKKVGDQGEEQLAAQSPKPIAEEDMKDAPESMEEMTDAAKAGEDAPKDATETAEGAAGKLGEEDQTEKDTLEPGQGELGETTDELNPDEKLEEAKPDEGALDETKDEAAGKAEEAGEEVDEAAEKPLDLTVLKGTKVNKAGNLVNENGDIIGRLVDGDAKKLLGKTCDGEGQIWNDSGKVIGKAEPIADTDRDEAAKAFAPFENFPDAIVEGDGRIMSEGRQVGEVIEGDAKRMKGSRVDEDGDILDRRGNVIGKAKSWDEPEEIPEEATDMSSLAGKRVNKAGNVVDSHGQIFGRVIEGNVKSLIGRMCDKEGNIMSESGEKIGKAELVSEAEREGYRDGPFAELPGCTVTKDGKVVTSAGEVVGRLTSGDGKALYGRSVDEDGDVVDKNGNVLGKAERWEEPEVEKKKDALAGRQVNREGNVVDENGNIIGKLVSGEVGICAGKEIDDDGDVVNSKGVSIGHVSLLADIPTESAEDKEKREQADKDRKLAGQLAASIEQSLDKIKPILKMITDKVDTAERTPKEELDEEQLVKEVKPLIEEGSQILTETNGVVRGMDPDGRIQRQAKHKSSTKDATPEEHHLAEVLKELTGNVTQTIDNAKRKIEGMPHAKKELNPLWGLLSEPLFQIVAAVGLLLNGVLSLVGRLLSGLGLGGIVDNLLGTLGLNKVLDGLGLGDVTGALTGKKDKKKK